MKQALYLQLHCWLSGLSRLTTKETYNLHITDPLWRVINSLKLSDAYMHQGTNHHWFRQWLVTWPAPSHYLNQCWNIVNWTLKNKPQWNLNGNSYIFIENVVWKMAAILFRLLLRVLFYFHLIFPKRGSIVLTVKSNIRRALEGN